jgi:hypothetical protein
MWKNELNRLFLKEDVQIAKENMKKCSTSLIIKKMQIILRFYLTSVWLAIIKNTSNYRCWRGCGRKKNPCTLLAGI